MCNKTGPETAGSELQQRVDHEVGINTQADQLFIGLGYTTTITVEELRTIVLFIRQCTISDVRRAIQACDDAAWHCLKAAIEELAGRLGVA